MLTARKICGMFAEVILQSHLAQEVRGSCVTLLTAQTQHVNERLTHILKRRHMREQVEVLEYDTEGAPHHAGLPFTGRNQASGWR